MKDKTLRTTSNVAGHNAALPEKRMGCPGIATVAMSLTGTGVKN
ncbi:hypothetical protein [Nitrosospira briensis]|nr:hypothetical protein [Nitrosospira briensis]SFO05785.1 hypothetical protein SAMN05216332_104102 [Nitrosospira briensis]